MKMRKIVVAALLIYIGFLFAPWIWLENTYGMKNIPHYDLTMWIFMLLYGILALIGFLGFVAFGVSKEPEQLEEFVEETVEETAEETVEAAVEELTEEEAPTELQVEAPELSEMSIDNQEPQEQKDRKASEIQPPAIWEEEEFE